MKAAVLSFFSSRSMFGLALIAAMAVGAVAQTFLALKFWGSLAGNGDRPFFQGVGILFAWGAPLLLAVASELAARRKAASVRWLVLRPIAAVMIAFNLAGDVGAIGAHSEADTHARAVQRAEYDAAQATVSEAPGRIRELREAIPPQWRAMPAGALESLAQGTRDRIAAYEARGRSAPPWLSEELAQREAAAATAAEIERVGESAGAAQAVVKRYGVAPETARPQIAVLKAALGWTGIAADEKTIGVVLVLGIATLLQLFVVAASIAAPFTVRENPQPKSDPTPSLPDSDHRQPTVPNIIRPRATQRPVAGARPKRRTRRGSAGDQFGWLID